MTYSFYIERDDEGCFFSIEEKKNIIFDLIEKDIMEGTEIIGILEKYQDIDYSNVDHVSIICFDYENSFCRLELDLTKFTKLETIHILGKTNIHVSGMQKPVEIFIE